MTRLPRLSGREVIDALGEAGFQIIRIKGSHHLLRHSDGRTTTVPVHGAEIIGPGLLSRILRDCELTRDQFVELCRR
jgi:predicted RNA binding protein YcfA (HicA-like mRNA interferase family)